ncbi:MAG: hypothetical protein ACRC33_23115 [Gemmataceae bacterium]
MTHTLLIATFLMAGQDPEPDSVPKGPPPRLMAVPAGGGTFLTTEAVQVPVNITKAVTAEEGGKRVTRLVTETVMRTEMRTRRVSFAGARGRTAGGKKLDADEVAKRLTTPQVVAISADGKPVDPAYLRLLKADVLVLELAGTAGGPAAMPVPVPFPAPAIRVAPVLVPPIRD